MDSYVDIQLKPDAEMRLNVLLNAVYTKLHKALYDLRSTDIGVSFPKYAVMLGNSLRLHGKESALHDLQNLNWIGGMSGYCNVSTIQSVPTDCKYRTISRTQTTMSQAKLKRLLKRGSISEDEVKQYKVKMFSHGLEDPFIELVSASNGRKHRRYIAFGELLDQPVAGGFDQFGLSKNATVPWF